MTNPQPTPPTTDEQPHLEPRDYWRLAAIFVGLLALLVGYYWVQKPITPRLALSLGGALLDIATVALLFVAAGGVGAGVLALLVSLFNRATDDGPDPEPLTHPERLAVTTLLGLGVVALVTLVLGLVGLFRAVVFVPLLVIAVVLLRRQVFAVLRDWRGLLADLPLESTWARLLAAFVAVFLLMALVRALAPPFAWDSLTYHLVGPKRYLADGIIATHPDNHFLGLSQNAEMIYAVVLSPFGREATPALAHFGFGLLGILATMGVARRYLDAAAAWLVALLLTGAFSFWLLLGWAYVDLATMAYGAGALIAAVRWRETRALTWLVLMGVFAGLAIGVKYTAGGVLIALLVYVALADPRPARIIRNGMLVGVAAVIVFLPWAVKGWLLYDNPIYPFLFGGVSWDALRNATFSTTGDGLLSSPDVWQLPVLPVAATIFGIEKTPGYSFTVNPWLLTAPLLLIPVWRWLDARARQIARDGLVFGGTLLVMWVLAAAFTAIGMQTRLMSPLLPVAALLGAAAFHGLRDFPEKPLHIRFLVQAALLLTMVLSLLAAVNTTIREDAPRYLFGFVNRAAYLDARPELQAYINAVRHLETLPPGATVRQMWEPRAFHCPAHIHCQPDILNDHWGYALRQGLGPDEVVTAWEADRIDYLLVWEAGLEFQLTDPRYGAENALFADVRESPLREVWTDGILYTLYALDG